MHFWLFSAKTMHLFTPSLQILASMFIIMEKIYENHFCAPPCVSPSLILTRFFPFSYVVFLCAYFPYNSDRSSWCLLESDM